jgi:hypothetical protein
LTASYWIPCKDRRRVRRFPSKLSLKYEVILGRRIARFGSGKTCNISSTGVLFQSDSALEEGSSVELLINWPAPYQGKQPMHLLIRGQIVRVEDGKRAALKVQYHCFVPCEVSKSRLVVISSRTASASTPPPPPAP